MNRKYYKGNTHLFNMKGYEDYYYINKDEIIQEFRESMDSEHLPENDEDLENWYKDELLEIAKDWYEE